MIRPFRDEVERYGHYSLAAESMYDHPFQWGSKRTGPDLARVGGRYSDEWHVEHLKEPAVAKWCRKVGHAVGVPYSEDITPRRT
jgi:cbb3-type cytochrome c oxidase subunit II